MPVSVIPRKPMLLILLIIVILLVTSVGYLFLKKNTNCENWARQSYQYSMASPDAADTVRQQQIDYCHTHYWKILLHHSYNTLIEKVSRPTVTRTTDSWTGSFYLQNDTQELEFPSIHLTISPDLNVLITITDNGVTKKYMGYGHKLLYGTLDISFEIIEDRDRHDTTFDLSTFTPGTILFTLEATDEPFFVVHWKALRPLGEAITKGVFKPVPELQVGAVTTLYGTTANTKAGAVLSTNEGEVRTEITAWPPYLVGKSVTLKGTYGYVKEPKYDGASASPQEVIGTLALPILREAVLIPTEALGFTTLDNLLAYHEGKSNGTTSLDIDAYFAIAQKLAVSNIPRAEYFASPYLEHSASTITLRLVHNKVFTLAHTVNPSNTTGVLVATYDLNLKTVSLDRTDIENSLLFYTPPIRKNYSTIEPVLY